MPIKNEKKMCCNSENWYELNEECKQALQEILFHHQKNGEVERDSPFSICYSIKGLKWKENTNEVALTDCNLKSNTFNEINSYRDGVVRVYEQFVAFAFMMALFFSQLHLNFNVIFCVDGKKNMNVNAMLNKN